MILDKKRLGEQRGRAEYLHENGVEAVIDGDHHFAHNKVVVIDESVVITGSMNFSEAGEERNAENVLVLRDASLAAEYTDNWNAHAQHSYSY